MCEGERGKEREMEGLLRILGIFYGKIVLEVRSGNKIKLVASMK